MNVTIYQIAERAGVSSSTVARVLRGDVKETQERSIKNADKIRRIAREMGYRPNRLARAFSRGRTYGIGLLYTDDAWVFEGVNMLVVNSLVRELQVLGYHLVFVPIDESQAWKDILLGGQIDGGVVFQTLPEDVTKALQEKELPLVLLGDNSDPTISQVVVDDFAGAYAATKHLGGLGHKRIMLYVHDSIKPHCSIGERQRGFETAMKDMELSSHASFLHAGEEDAVHRLLHGNSRPTAIVCYSNLEATLLAHAMWQYGVSIPRDLSIVGFNDIFATKYMTPPLTTVGFDAERIGELGARIVIDEIDQEEIGSGPRIEVIKPKLIVRGSTAQVK